MFLCSMCTHIFLLLMRARDPFSIRKGSNSRFIQHQLHLSLSSRLKNLSPEHFLQPRNQLASSIMPEKVPFQIVTRGAARRAEIAAARRQAAIDNAASDNVQTANIPTVLVTAPSPQTSPTPPRDLDPALLQPPVRTSPRRQNSAASTRPSRTPHACSTRPSMRRTAPYQRPARRNTLITPTTKVQAATNGQAGSINDENEMGQDPLIMNNQFVADNRDANNNQDHNQNQMGQDPLIMNDNSVVENGDANDNQDHNQLVRGSIDQNSNRCTSALCPVPAEIPHERGLYLHDGQPNQRAESAVFGLSNPPPSVWLMIDRVQDGVEDPRDLIAIEAFVRIHEPPLGTILEYPPSGTDDPSFGTHFAYEDFE